jgi:uncharacterized membrane protein YciS (DUF1049 family)
MLVRFVLLALAAVLFAAGWVAGVAWSGLVWSWAAVRVGFQHSRKSGDD